MPRFLIGLLTVTAVGLTYLALMVAFFTVTFLVGLGADREEWVLPGWLGSVLRNVTAPFYGFSRMDAITSGTTTLFMTGEPPRDLVAHEAQHRQETKDRAPAWLPRRLGLIVGAVHYGFLYMVDYVKHGYWNNRFEIAARAAAGQVD